MIPVLLLMLFAALNTEYAATSSEEEYKYVFAFVENIASYHPVVPRNLIYITSLAHNTKVKVFTPPTDNVQKTMEQGQTELFSYDGNVELNKSKFSNRSVRISSNQKVIVSAVSSKNTSMQTALIVPNDKLGTKYFIPPVPTIQGTTDDSKSRVTEREPFKLTIINTDQKNKVIVEAQPSKNFTLEPHQVTYVFITDDTYVSVTADHPVAVIFGHTCAICRNCTCSLLYTVLPPAKEETLKFYIPTVVAEDAEDKTYILLSDKGSTKKEKFDSNSPLVKTAGPAILFRPGLLLTLIPETDFAACFLISILSDVENYAVIVVHKDVSSGVHIGKSPLENPEWKPLKSTDYVTTKVLLEGSGQIIIWHSSSTMAVYFLGKTREETLSGNPAVVINKSPDHSGCVVTPEVIEIGEAKSWQESVAYCRSRNLELISFPTAEHQKQIYTKISHDLDPGVQEVWIGMRRSSLTSDWYWLNGDALIDSDMNWAENEPGPMEEGQCAIMSVESSKNFGWSDKDCCEKAPPVCYRPPILFLPIPNTNPN